MLTAIHSFHQKSNMIAKGMIFTLFVIVGAILANGPAAAQAYRFEVDTGTFTSIKDTGTRVNQREIPSTSIYGPRDEGLFESITIPFTFRLFGQTITTLTPTTNMFLTSNSDFSCGLTCYDNEPASINGRGNLNHQFGIYPFWDDGYATKDARVFYSTTGDEGNRVFTIEFSEWSFNHRNKEDVLSAQVRLFEADNRIEFIYSRGDSLPTNNNGATIGLAASREVTGSRTRYYGLSDSSNRPQGTDTFVDNIVKLPQEGQIYRFSVAPDVDLPAIADRVLSVGQSVSIVLPESTSAVGTLTYSLAATPALPAGVTFNANSKTLSGTPTTAMPTRTYTYMVTDDHNTTTTADDTSDTEKFSLTVTSGPIPSADSYTFEFTVGVAHSVNLPAHSLPAGRSKSLTSYTLVDPSRLPAGITYTAPATNELTASGGTLSTAGITDTKADQNATHYLRFYATDSSGLRGGQVTITINVSEPLPIAPQLPHYTLNILTSTRINLPPFTFESGTLTYSVENLPIGLNFDSDTRVISGSYGTSGDDNKILWIDYTATDSTGDSVTVPVRLTLNDSLPMPPAEQNLIYLVGITSSESLLPFTGGDGTLTYRLNASPALPTGLSFTGNGLLIEGIAAAAQDSTVYSYTAADVDGDTRTRTFTLSVEADKEPVAPTPPNGAASWELDFSPIEGLSVYLPPFTGGNGRLTYELTENTPPYGGLPSGFRFVPRLRFLNGPRSGTPQDDSASWTLRYSATDSDATQPDTTHTTISVNLVDSIPSFEEATIDPIVVRQEKSVGNIPLPAATGGDGVVRYSFSPGLPIGLNAAGIYLPGSSRALVGAPLVEQPEKTYNFIATDTDGDTASIPFTITVVTNTRPRRPQASFVINAIPGEDLDIDLPAYTMGNPPLTHFAPNASAVPNWIDLNLTDLTLTGTVPGTNTYDSTIITFNYNARDNDGDEGSPVTVELMITDSSPVSDNLRVRYEYQSGETINEVLPQYTAADGDISYVLVSGSALPDWLEFDPETHSISGVAPATNNDDDSYNVFSYTATDADGDTGSPTTVSVRVIDLQPTASLRNVSFDVQRGGSIAEDLPTFSGGDGTAKTSLTSGSSLPGWLTFSTDDHRLTGTAPVTNTDDTAVHTFSYEAIDSDGDVSLPVNVTVNVLDDTPTAPRTVPLRVDIRGTFGATLPEFTDGDGELTYSLTGLPTGLEFSSTNLRITGVLDGTNSLDAATHTLTYSAHDTDGDSAATSIQLTVNDDIPLAPGSFAVSFSQNLAGSQTLPSFEGGTGTLTYALLASPALPTGLTFTAADLSIAGTPVSLLTPTNFTYTATDEDGDISAQIFTLEVVADSVPQVPVISDYTFTPGQLVAVTLPAFTGGDGPLTYSLIDQGANTLTLPPGLFFIAGTRTLYGSPTATSNDDSVAQRSYTYSATDSDTSDPDKTDVSFSIEIVDAMPSFGAQTVEDINGRVNTPIPSVTLPASDTGTGDVTYRISPFFLPVGVSFDSYTRVFSGTPAIPWTERTYSYEATDSDGDVAALTFTFGVAFDNVPTLSQTERRYTYMPGVSVSESLTTAVGGDAPLTYFIASNANSKPAWLTFTSSPTPGISGDVPATAQDDSLDYTFSYAARDADGDVSASATVIIAVVDSMPEIPAVPQISLTIGSVFSQILPAATGGDFLVEYSLRGLPQGLDFDDQTRTISGTVDGTSVDNNSVYQLYYTGTDTDADESEVIIFMRVIDEQPVAPPSVALTFSVNQAGTQTLPAFTGGTGSLTYTLAASPTLPTGLSFTAGTRTISGTANALTTAQTYTYTATDSDGDTASQTFTLAVDNDATPIAPTGTFEYSFVPGEQVSVTLPVFTGGDGTLSYSLTDQGSTQLTLPANLSFNASSRQISGIVLGTGNDDSVAKTPFTYSATDSDTTNADTTSVTISITVVDEIPSLANQTITSIVGLQGRAVTPRRLPTSTSGTGTLTHLISPTLPSGMTFNTQTRMLGGTPVDATPQITYTYSVRDVDGDIASIRFTMTFEANIGITAPEQTLAISLQPGVDAVVELPPFTGGNGVLTYSIDSSTPLPSWASFDPKKLELTFDVPDDTNGDDTEHLGIFHYVSEDVDGDTQRSSFSIAIIDDIPQAPTVLDLFLPINVSLEPIILPPFSLGTLSAADLTYTLAPLPQGLDFAELTRVLFGTPEEQGTTVVTYTGSDLAGDSRTTTFTIEVSEVPSFEELASTALPALSTNLALVVANSISSRAELALKGLSQGLEINTPTGHYQLGNDLSSHRSSAHRRNPLRFGVWYNSTEDELSDTTISLNWRGSTDTTSLGFDIGYDLTPRTSMVVGVMETSSATTALYNNHGSNTSGIFDLNLDSTAYYAGIGWDWLSVWHTAGDGTSAVNDTARNSLVPTTFEFEASGLSMTYEAIKNLYLGFEIGNLSSTLNLNPDSHSGAGGYQNMLSETSHESVTFQLSYEIIAGLEKEIHLIPKVRVGSRSLANNNSVTTLGTTTGREASETGLGLDVINQKWGLTIGVELTSIEDSDYSSNSTQWHIRWESGKYNQGPSVILRPSGRGRETATNSILENDFNTHSDFLRQSAAANADGDASRGLDLEVGFGILTGKGTVTPFYLAKNLKSQANEQEEVGVRYSTVDNLTFEMKMRQIKKADPLAALFGIQGAFQRENSLVFSSRLTF